MGPTQTVCARACVFTTLPPCLLSSCKGPGHDFWELFHVHSSLAQELGASTDFRKGPVGGVSESQTLPELLLCFLKASHLKALAYTVSAAKSTLSFPLCLVNTSSHRSPA